MDGLPGYDSWKLASPPEYDLPDTCECGEENRTCEEDAECDEAYERWADK